MKRRRYAAVIMSLLRPASEAMAMSSKSCTSPVVAEERALLTAVLQVGLMQTTRSLVDQRRKNVDCGLQWTPHRRQRGPDPVRGAQRPDSADHK